MRRALLPLVAALAAPVVTVPAQQVGDVLSTDFAVRTLDGRVTSLRDVAGPVRVINLWATWCPPCRAELPSLAALADSLADDGVTVHAVAVDDPRRVARFLAGLVDGAPPVLVEHERLPRAWGRWALPMTYVLGPDDRLLFVHRGAARWNDSDVVALLRRLAAPHAGVD